MLSVMLFGLAAIPIRLIPNDKCGARKFHGCSSTILEDRHIGAIGFFHLASLMIALRIYGSGSSFPTESVLGRSALWFRSTSLNCHPGRGTKRTAKDT